MYFKSESYEGRLFFILERRQIEGYLWEKVLKGERKEGL